MGRVAIYAGSFDPITNGHLWMIREGAKLFDKLVVFVASNPEKKYLFSPTMRRYMVTEAVRDADIMGVTVEFGSGFVVRYAELNDIGFVLRGIRTVTDFDYERALRLINSDISPKVQTVFLMPPRDVAEVSSSLVKGLVGPSDWDKIVEKYVPPIVLKELKELKGKVP